MITLKHVESEFLYHSYGGDKGGRPGGHGCGRGGRLGGRSGSGGGFESTRGRKECYHYGVQGHTQPADWRLHGATLMELLT